MFTTKQSDIFYNDQTKEMFVCKVSSISAQRCEGSEDIVYGALPIVYKINKDSNYQSVIYPKNLNTFTTDITTDLYDLVPSNCYADGTNFAHVTKPLINYNKSSDRYSITFVGKYTATADGFGVLNYIFQYIDTDFYLLDSQIYIPKDKSTKTPPFTFSNGYLNSDLIIGGNKLRWNETAKPTEKAYSERVTDYNIKPTHMDHNNSLGFNLINYCPGSDTDCLTGSNQYPFLWSGGYITYNPKYTAFDPAHDIRVDFRARSFNVPSMTAYRSIQSSNDDANPSRWIDVATTTDDVGGLSGAGSGFCVYFYENPFNSKVEPQGVGSTLGYVQADNVISETIDAIPRAINNADFENSSAPWYWQAAISDQLGGTYHTSGNPTGNTPLSGWELGGSSAGCAEHQPYGLSPTPANWDADYPAINNLFISANTVLGINYSVTVTVINCTAGTLKVFLGTINGVFLPQTAGVTDNGIHKINLTASGETPSQVYFQASNDFDGCIDNVSIIECGEITSVNGLVINKEPYTVNLGPQANSFLGIGFDIKGDYCTTSEGKQGWFSGGGGNDTWTTAPCSVGIRGNRSSFTRVLTCQSMSTVAASAVPMHENASNSDGSDVSFQDYRIDLTNKGTRVTVYNKLISATDYNKILQFDLDSVKDDSGKKYSPWKGFYSKEVITVYDDYSRLPLHAHHILAIRNRQQGETEAWPGAFEAEIDRARQTYMAEFARDDSVTRLKQYENKFFKIKYPDGQSPDQGLNIGLNVGLSFTSSNYCSYFELSSFEVTGVKIGKPNKIPTEIDNTTTVEYLEESSANLRRDLVTIPTKDPVDITMLVTRESLIERIDLCGNILPPVETEYEEKFTGTKEIIEIQIPEGPGPETPECQPGWYQYWPMDHPLLVSNKDEFTPEVLARGWAGPKADIFPISSSGHTLTDTAYANLFTQLGNVSRGYIPRDAGGDEITVEEWEALSSAQQGDYYPGVIRKIGITNWWRTRAIPYTFEDGVYTLGVESTYTQDQEIHDRARGANQRLISVITRSGDMYLLGLSDVPLATANKAQYAEVTGQSQAQSFAADLQRRIYDGAIWLEPGQMYEDSGYRVNYKWNDCNVSTDWVKPGDEPEPEGLCVRMTTQELKVHYTKDNDGVQLYWRADIPVGPQQSYTEGTKIRPEKVTVQTAADYFIKFVDSLDGCVYVSVMTAVKQFGWTYEQPETDATWGERIKDTKTKIKKLMGDVVDITGL